MIHNYKLFYEHAHTYSDVHNNQQYDSNSANLCNDFFTGFEQFEQSYATYMCVIHIFTNFKPIQAEGNVAHVRLVCSGGPASENKGVRQISTYRKTANNPQMIKTDRSLHLTNQTFYFIVNDLSSV